MRVFPVEDVSVRGEVLPVQRRIEFREHLVRIEEGLQIRPFDQQRLVALPAFAVNQVRIEGTVFVGVFQIQSAGFDGALHLQE